MPNEKKPIDRTLYLFPILTYIDRIDFDIDADVEPFHELSADSLGPRTRSLILVNA